MNRARLAAGLLLIVLLIHARWIVEGGILGAPQSDTIRGLWGLDQQARGLPLPFWTDRVGFPEGSKLLILPFASSLLAAPLVLLLGAPTAWNLWVLALLWATGYASARLAQEWLESDRAGWIVGAAMISQPMIWMAMTDGTAENVAFWPVPLFLLLLLRAAREGSPAIAAAAGGAATLIALDSPYHAVFTLPLTLPLLPEIARALRTPEGRPDLRAAARLLGPLALACFAGAGLCYGLYYGLPVSSAPPDDPAANAVRLATWLQWQLGQLREPWDWTLAPTFLPLPLLLGAIPLALAAPRRALPWLAVGWLCLMLSLGPDRSNPATAAQYLGAWAGSLLDAWASLCAAYPLPIVRFVRRWLLPAAFCMAMAMEIGWAQFAARPSLPARLTSLLPTWGGPLIGLLLVASAAYRTGYPLVLPRLHLEIPASARFIAEHRHPGHILILPRVRAAKRLHQRDELPVFADLSPDLTSSAEFWLQVGAERGAINTPTGLLTMVARRGRTAARQAFLRDLDDLTLPQTIGSPIPPSATMEPARRRAEAAQWVTAGLRFLLVDEAAYAAEGMSLLRQTFDGLIAQEQHFDDGTGVTVFVLSPAL